MAPPRPPAATGWIPAEGVVLQPLKPPAAKVARPTSAARRVKRLPSIKPPSTSMPLSTLLFELHRRIARPCPLASVARRIGVIAAGRRRRSVVRISVGVIVRAGRRRSHRRGPEAKGRRSRHPAVIGMTIPGAMPSAAPGDEASTAITARGKPVDEQRSRSRRLRKAPFEHRHLEGQLVAFELWRFQDQYGVLNRIALRAQHRYRGVRG